MKNNHSDKHSKQKQDDIWKIMEDVVSGYDEEQDQERHRQEWIPECRQWEDGRYVWAYDGAQARANRWDELINLCRTSDYKKYTVNGIEYFAIPNWPAYQWGDGSAVHSMYAAPEDRYGYTASTSKW